MDRHRLFERFGHNGRIPGSALHRCHALLYQSDIQAILDVQLDIQQAALSVGRKLDVHNLVHPVAVIIPAGIVLAHIANKLAPVGRLVHLQRFGENSIIDRRHSRAMPG
ncbi:MAG TPA: hypothetical protein DCS43_14640 [Verrucomicrobia bacterium]|nr:hypothetical protein [Verrucomicrobiota bacterium]